MAKIFDVNINHILEEARFNPKYFQFIQERDSLINKSPLKFVTLSDNKYFPVLSDGIHSKVTLEENGEIKYLYVHNLKEGFIDTTDNEFLNLVNHMANLSKELKQDDVLISVVGTLGNTAMFSDYIPYRCSLPRNIAFIRTNRDMILPEFLECFFLSSFSKRQCIFSGGGNIQGLLSLSKLKRFVIPIPNLEIQQEFCNKYRRVIVLQKRFLNTIRECQDEFHQHMGIDLSQIKRQNSFSTSASSMSKQSIWTPNLYDPFPDVIIMRISEKYQLAELGEICTFDNGNEIGSVNYQGTFSKTSNSVPFIRTSDIFNFEIDSYPDFYADSSLYYLLNQDFKEGDIIINNDGKIGFPSIITKEDKCIFQSHIRRLRTKFNREIPNAYIFLCLTMPEIGNIQFNKYTVVQSTIPTLSDRAKHIKIPLLHASIRQHLSDRIRNAYSLVEEKKRMIKQLRIDINKLVDNIAITE